MSIKHISDIGNPEYIDDGPRHIQRVRLTNLLLELNSCIKKNDIQLVKNLIEPDYQFLLNYYDSNGNLPVVTAIRKDRNEIAIYLINKFSTSRVTYLICEIQQDTDAEKIIKFIIDVYDGKIDYINWRLSKQTKELIMTH